MSGAAVGLILVSAFMHAGWNLLARAGRPEDEFFRRILVVVVGVVLAPALVLELARPTLPVRVWAYLVASGAFSGLYFLGLARAYARTDFTVVYPVARALPVLLVGLGDLARGRAPSLPGWVGMALVALGCAMAPLHSLDEISVERYLNRATAWILLAALGSVGYSLIDKVAAEAIPRGPASAFRYCCFYFLFSGLAYAVCLRATRARSGGSRAQGWKGPALGAPLTFGAYWLTLWVYQMADRAGYVVAFRQLSIVIGVVAASRLFGERGAAIRITAACLVCAGLVIVGLLG